MKAIVGVARWLISVLFLLRRRMGVRHRVCFFSRQASWLTPDFALLQQQLRKADPTMDIVTICCRYRGRQDGLLRFLRQCVRSVFLAASAQVCVLDGYWPTICLLRDKRDLRVIQIWHSVGKIKKSGYQTLDKPSGRSGAMARALCMHRNYDAIIAGGPAWNPFYCAAFDVTEDRLRNWGLPRLDHLVSAKGEAAQCRSRFPELAGRTVVLYAPTYRTYPLELPDPDFSCFPKDRYAVLCRFHPNQALAGGSRNSDYPQEDIFDLLQMCDYFITDYSSLALEAAAMDKPTLFYLPDDERYRSENGVNIDLFQAMPHCTFTAQEDLFRMIDSGAYPMEALQAYKKMYLPQDLGHATEKITELILQGDRTLKKEAAAC